MPSQIPIEFLVALWGLILLLGGLVYRNLNDKIKTLEDKLCQVPIIGISSDIAEIKNDIKWLKDEMRNKK